AEQNAVHFFVYKTGFPAMWHMRRRYETKPMTACVEHFAVHHPFCHVAAGKIIDADHLPHQAAYRRGVGSDGEPFVQSTALVRLKMAEADPTQFSRIDQRRHGFLNVRKNSPHSGVK